MQEKLLYVTGQFGLLKPGLHLNKHVVDIAILPSEIDRQRVRNPDHQIQVTQIPTSAQNDHYSVCNRSYNALSTHIIVLTSRPESQISREGTDHIVTSERFNIGATSPSLLPLIIWQTDERIQRLS